MTDVASALISYFENEIPELENNYTWKIPNIEGFDRCGEIGYEVNVALKNYLNGRWVGADYLGKLELCKLIVSDWGGVKNNKKETLKRYADELLNDNPLTPLKGVASYSKIFSIADPSKYVIYDARVAVCLNAVQWNANVKEGLAFNYIPGRNNVTGHAGKKAGFVYRDAFKTMSLVGKGWKSVKKNDTYATYLELLNECHKNLPQYQLYDLEMVLFANAEKECLSAINSL